MTLIFCNNCEMKRRHRLNGNCFYCSSCGDINLTKENVLVFTNKQQKAMVRVLIKRELRKKGIEFDKEDKTINLLNKLCEMEGK